MRLILVSTLLLSSAVALGAPVRAPAPSVGPEAQKFAVQLINVAQQVNQNYIRPVPVPELLRAAVTGLYEAAHKTVPADLKQRLEKAAARGELVLVIQQAYTETAAPVPSGRGNTNAIALQSGTLRSMRAEVSELTRQPMTVACQALFRSLDPYSGVINPDEQRRNLALDQEAQGVGLELFDYSGAGPFVVKTVYPGGSAQRAGIRPGDQITRVNDKSVETPGVDLKGVTALKDLLHPPVTDPNAMTLPNPKYGLPDSSDEASRKVRVTFKRPGGYPRTVELERSAFRVETILGVGRDDGHRWHYWADRKHRIAHVRVSLLSHGTAEELTAVLDRLLKDGMRGLVLDMRWTPGGYLTESTEVARLFLGDVLVATVKDRNEEDRVYRGGGPSKLIDLPMAVLVNGETSGGAELIAAALQDHKRAVVVGQRTLGKASVQRPLQVEIPGLQLKMTTGTFLRPSGKNLHRFPESKPGDDWGVKPDVEFRVSPQLGRQLKQWWMLQTLRPGPSMERLPLDDPSNDAQRQAAVTAVLEKMTR